MVQELRKRGLKVRAGVRVSGIHLSSCFHRGALGGLVRRKAQLDPLFLLLLGKRGFGAPCTSI